MAKKTMSPMSVGRKVFIRTVTHYYTGMVSLVTKEEVVLTEAAWVADTGRFAEALRTGSLTEVEPYPDGPVSINRGAIVDVSVWAHDLPREQQ